MEILDLFEPIVMNVIRSFKNTHSHRLQNLILFMLTRMVCVGVDFARLDRDKSFMKYLVKLITEMNAYLMDREPDLTLYQLMDFIAVLIFTVRYQPKEINDQNLLSAISVGLNSTNWSTSVLLRALSPLMIRSYLFSIRETNPEIKEGKETAITNTYGERLLLIFLDHIRFVECLSVLTLLLENVSRDPVTSKNLSTTICDKMIVENKLEMEINWFNLEFEIRKVTGFFATLLVDVNDSEQSRFDKAAREILQDEILSAIPQPGDGALSPTTEKMAQFGGKNIEAFLLKALLLMKFLNRSNTTSINDNRSNVERSIPQLADLLQQYMSLIIFACGQYLRISNDNTSRFKQVQSLLAYILLEAMELQTQLSTQISRIGAESDDNLQPVHELMESLILVLDDIYIARHFVQFQCAVYTSVLGLLRNHALLANRKGMRGSLRFARKFFKYLTDKLAEVHEDTIRTSSYIELIENQSFYLLICELAVCVRPEGGLLQKRLDNTNENLLLVMEDQTGSCQGLDLLVSEDEQTLSPQFWRLAL
jgi:hypothetical protein